MQTKYTHRGHAFRHNLCFLFPNIPTTFAHWFGCLPRCYHFKTSWHKVQRLVYSCLKPKEFLSFDFGRLLPVFLWIPWLYLLLSVRYVHRLDPLAVYFHRLQIQPVLHFCFSESTHELRVNQHVAIAFIVITRLYISNFCHFLVDQFVKSFPYTKSVFALHELVFVVQCACLSNGLDHKIDIWRHMCTLFEMLFQFGLLVKVKSAFVLVCKHLFIRL